MSAAHCSQTAPRLFLSLPDLAPAPATQHTLELSMTIDFEPATHQNSSSANAQSRTRIKERANEPSVAVDRAASLNTTPAIGGAASKPSALTRRTFMNHMITSAALLAGSVPALNAASTVAEEPTDGAVKSEKADALERWAAGPLPKGIDRDSLLVEARLVRLASKFIDDAKKIDPTVTGGWLMTDQLRSRSAPQAVYLERPRAPFIRRPQRPQRARGLTMAEVIEAHQIAWEQFTASCDGADTQSSSYAGEAGERRWQRCNDKEERAMNRLLSYKARSTAETRARAKYLLDGLKARRLSLTDDGLQLLLEAEVTGGSFW